MSSVPLYFSPSEFSLLTSLTSSLSSSSVDYFSFPHRLSPEELLRSLENLSLDSLSSSPSVSYSLEFVRRLFCLSFDCFEQLIQNKDEKALKTILKLLLEVLSLRSLSFHTCQFNPIQRVASLSSSFSSSFLPLLHGLLLNFIDVPETEIVSSIALLTSFDSRDSLVSLCWNLIFSFPLSSSALIAPLSTLNEKQVNLLLDRLLERLLMTLTSPTPSPLDSSSSSRVPRVGQLIEWFNCLLDSSFTIFSNCQQTDLIERIRLLDWLIRELAIPNLTSVESLQGSLSQLQQAVTGKRINGQKKTNKYQIETVQL
jgi:hypothetical protein